MFVPGQLVLCVNDRFDGDWQGDPRWSVPQRGRVYTIRDVIIAWAGHHAGDQQVRLQEITNPEVSCSYGQGEPYFWHGRFRPLDDSRLDVFRKALTDAPKDEELVE